MYSTGRRVKCSPEITACKTIIRSLFSKRYKSFAWVFYQPLEASYLGLDDYHDIVEEPMDLTTIRRRLLANFYHNALDFARDVRLIFYNTYLYTTPNHLCYEMAKNLQLVFEEMFRKVPIEHMTPPDSTLCSASSEVDVESPCTSDILNPNINCSESLIQPLSKAEVLQPQPQPEPQSEPQPAIAPETPTCIAEMPVSAQEDFDLQIKLQQLEGVMVLNVIHMIHQLEGLSIVHPNKELEFDVRSLKPHTKRSILAYLASKGITGKRLSRPKNPYDKENWYNL